MPKKPTISTSRLPQRGESTLATKGTHVDTLGGQSGLTNAGAHVPDQGASHSARGGSHTDGLQGIAKDITHTKAPVRPASPKAAGKSTNKGA